MDKQQLIERLREHADYIFMSASCGCNKILFEAIDGIEELLAENKQLRNDLIMQTVLAQNGQSAIETNKLLTKELQAAIDDINILARNSANVCYYCKNNQPCLVEECKDYIEGVGLTDKDGKYIDRQWSCTDFYYGTCPKLENTPCDDCFSNCNFGFEWRGVRHE